MYCYTYVNQFSCVFNELQLWSHISSEHPMFLKTVAGFSKIRLNKAAEEKLLNIHNGFSKLHQDAIYLKKQQNTVGVKRLLNEFLTLDADALSFYPQLLGYGKDNNTWLELVNHIIMEQKFMYELIMDLMKQIRL